MNYSIYFVKVFIFTSNILLVGLRQDGITQKTFNNHDVYLIVSILSEITSMRKNELKKVFVFNIAPTSTCRTLDI